MIRSKARDFCPHKRSSPGTVRGVKAHSETTKAEFIKELQTLSSQGNRRQRAGQRMQATLNEWRDIKPTLDAHSMVAITNADDTGAMFHDLHSVALVQGWRFRQSPSIIADFQLQATGILNRSAALVGPNYPSQAKAKTLPAD